MTDKDSGTPRVFLARHGTQVQIPCRFFRTKILTRRNWMVKVRSLYRNYRPWAHKQRSWASPGNWEGYSRTRKADRPIQYRPCLYQPAKTCTEDFRPSICGPWQRKHERNESYHYGKADWMELWPVWRVANWSDPYPEKGSRFGSGETVGYLERRLWRRRVGARYWNILDASLTCCRNPGQVTDRLDSLIETIKDLQRGSMHGKKPADVIVIAHGHCLRAFVKRWLKFPMEFPLSMMLEPGGVGVLRWVFV